MAGIARIIREEPLEEVKHEEWEVYPFDEGSAYIEVDEEGSACSSTMLSFATTPTADRAAK